MKSRYIIFTVFSVMAVIGLYLGIPTPCEAYELILPLPPVEPVPALPYCAETDYYHGAACVQMVLNTCPDGSGHYHSQQYLYQRIAIHNTEGTYWFSDPVGIRDTLMDSILSPCGTWVDISGPDKEVVMGKILYWMDKNNFLTPVSIGTSEYWIVIYGFETNQSPSNPSELNPTVTLDKIYFYDTIPGCATIDGTVTGEVWMNETYYWKYPLNMPGSTWHDKFIAVLEPPKVNIQVKVPKRVLEGPILNQSQIKRNCTQMIEEMKKKKLTRESFQAFTEPPKIGKIFLVNAYNADNAYEYKYYMVFFQNHCLIAIFNAYNGKFEEMRRFKGPQTYILDSNTIAQKVLKILASYKSKQFKILKSEFKYYPGMDPIGRFSPIWQVDVYPVEAYGKKNNLKIFFSHNGKYIKGLESLAVPGKLPYPDGPAKDKKINKNKHEMRR
jgi:hypothetical protein